MAGRVLSDEQSALSVELLASLAPADARGRVREALRRKRAFEEQNAVLRAAAREDHHEAAAAAAAAAQPRELLPTVRLTLRSRAGDTRAVVVRRAEGVGALLALVVAKLRVHKKAVHALCAGAALLSLDAMPDGAVVEFADASHRSSPRCPWTARRRCSPCAACSASVATTPRCAWSAQPA